MTTAESTLAISKQYIAEMSAVTMYIPHVSHSADTGHATQKKSPLSKVYGSNGLFSPSPGAVGCIHLRAEPAAAAGGSSQH